MCGIRATVRFKRAPAELEEEVGDGDLHGSAATGVNLSRIDFPADVGFINADLSEAELYNADLSGADLSNGRLTDAILPDSLSDATLQGTDLTYTDISGEKLQCPVCQEWSAELKTNVPSNVTAVVHTGKGSPSFSEPIDGKPAGVRKTARNKPQNNGEGWFD